MFEQVRQLLAHQFEVDENTITMDTNIADDLGADSLDVVEDRKSTRLNSSHRT